MLRSTSNLIGVVIDGIALGEPSVDEETGEFVWDHPGLVNGDIVPNDWSEFNAA